MEKLRELIVFLEELRSQFKFKIEETYLFVYLGHGKRGVPFRREYVNDHIKKAVRLCGIDKPFHTHLARHTMASLIAGYCSIDVLKARLGHVDKTTTLQNKEIIREISEAACYSLLMTENAGFQQQYYFSETLRFSKNSPGNTPTYSMLFGIEYLVRRYSILASK